MTTAGDAPEGMRFTATGLDGCYLVEPVRRPDDRGFFARTFCADEFTRRGLTAGVAQCSVSHNAAAGTLRGLHYQVGEPGEAKLVRCTRGRVFDVAVDLRPASPTFGRWTGVELSEENRLALFVPEGFAHGFVTLEPASEVFYQISVPYRPGDSAGVRWDDPALAISWPPMEPLTISARDRALPTLEAVKASGRLPGP
ncbi:MAG TPA: dTDP-4-dehydrorhamnose 3,5-epimerase [Acidimicrobiales bacterium]|nr:dTDP-4-dehydrorhamnose 3,5-epimerase [Acidimicrobiales bacterium]